MEYKSIKIDLNISDSELFQIVDSFNVPANENDICEYPDIKHLSFEIKEKIFKRLMTLDDIKNPIFILNVLNLVKNYNDFDEAFFSNDLIFFEKLEDYLDLRINLTEEVRNLQKKVALYYFSLFTSVGKVEYTILDAYVELPQFMKSLFLTSDIVTLSGIVSGVKDLNINEFLQVKDSNYYLSNLLSGYLLSNSLINDLNTRVQNGEDNG